MMTETKKFAHSYVMVFKRRRQSGFFAGAGAIGNEVKSICCYVEFQ